MKKIPLIFLLSLIVFTVFLIISLSKSNQSVKLSNTSISPTITSGNNSNNTSNPSLCIITINGQRYDVTQYRYQHQGGDIFTCGTDMSAIFAGQHSQKYLNKMKSYLVP